MQPDARVLLIGGSSHLGKSTLAAGLADRLGWEARSTDKLARHPGRPWAEPPAEVPPHVEEHYLTLTDDARFASVLLHYESVVWPLAEALIGEHARGPSLILEGSAILPALVGRRPGVTAVWLTGDDDLIHARIAAGSRYADRSRDGQAMIAAFAARSLRFNSLIVREVDRLGLVRIDVAADATVADLIELVLERATGRLSN